jgi:hypothetical protein
MIALKKGLYFFLFLIKITSVFGQNIVILQDTISNNISKELDEVVIKGKRPVMQFKHDKLILNVNRSYLKNFNKISSVFSHIPDMIVSTTGEISMFGRSRVIFFINDIAVVSQSQVKALKPSDIDRIEIIKEPGSEYSASADAIIKIYLLKDRNEDFSLIINNNTSFGRKVSNDVNLSLFTQKKKISQYLTYYNDFSKFKQYDISGTYTYFENQYYISQRDITTEDIIKENNIFYSIDYSADESNTIGLQFSGIIERDISNDCGTQTIKLNDILENKRLLDNIEDESKQLYNLSLNYENKMNPNRLFSIISDYAFSNVELNNDANERQINSEYKTHSRIISNAKYNIFSVNPIYKLSNKKNEIIIGAKYSFMKTLSDVDYIIPNKIDYNNINEHLVAFYAAGTLQLNSSYFRLGLRSEYADLKVKTDNKSGWDFFPNIIIGNKFSESINLTATYRTSIKRPTFNSLNPQVIYRDSLYYITGNPKLKSSIYHIVALSLNIPRLYFYLGYHVYKNYIIMEDIQDENRPGVVIGSYGNLDKKISSLNGSVAYSYDYEFFSVTASMNINKPFSKILFEGKPLELNKMIWMFKFSGNIEITQTTSMNFSFRYTSKGNSGNIYYRSPSNNFTLGFEQYALKKRLLISLSITDIFHGNNAKWESYSNNIRYEMYPNNDSRRLIISLEYKFGKSDKTIREKSANSDNINRM